MVASRLLMGCLEVKTSMAGNRIIGIVAGWFRIVGVEKGVNKFSFILVVSGYREIVGWSFL